MDIKPYLKIMIAKEASDLFVTVNSPIKVRLEGKIFDISNDILTGTQTEAIAYELMNEHQITELKTNLGCDFAFSLDDSTRFRVNIFFQRGDIGIVLRRIPNKIPTISDLGMPEILNKLVMNKRGLILMVGAAGSGKSTTLAAMLNHRNENISGHILTIEDPIEFSHSNKKSIVNQREIGIDTLSYSNALKASLRESPDMILIGEIRDRQTMETVIELSNTGHLILSTMHANNANQALERIINLFPQQLHRQLLMDISFNVRAVISQRLVLAVDDKRCAAIEIMLNTPYIAELILKGELLEIKGAMAESGQKGMQTFDTALFNLYKEGRISLEEALNNADSITNLEAKINFG